LGIEDLIDVINKIIIDRLQDHRILIWYDEGGTLSIIMEEVISEKYKKIIYKTSYLLIRSKIEQTDPEFKEKWFIYVPYSPFDPSWLRDYETFGTSINKTLEDILQEKYQLKSDFEIKNLLKGQNAKILTANWTKFKHTFQLPLRKNDIIKALLAIIFGQETGFNLPRAILEYISSNLIDGKLQRSNLKTKFIEIIKEELGLRDLNEATLMEQIAIKLLLSDLVSKLGTEKLEELQDILPSKEKLIHWVRITNEWMSNISFRDSFLEWSEKVETSLNIHQKITFSPELIEVSTFKCVDQVLLNEFLARIKSDPNKKENIEYLMQIAKKRKKLIWAVLKRVRFWEIIEKSTELYLRCYQTKNMKFNDLEEIIHDYTSSEGAWQIDRLYRSILSSEIPINEELNKLLIKPAERYYTNWLSQYNTEFINLLDKRGFNVNSLLNQKDFWRKIIKEEESLFAIFFIDALRFELGQFLTEIISEKTNIAPMITSLPSITEVGMASLLPYDNEVKLEVINGNLKVFLGTESITTKNERIKWLERKFRDNILTIDLDKLLESSNSNLQTSLKGKKILVVMDRDIDKAGTFLSDVNLELFNKLVRRIDRAAKKLHNLGFHKVIVVTDHGFLLTPRDYKFNVIKGLPSGNQVKKSDRYILGKFLTLSELISIPITNLGYDGNIYLGIPKNLDCIAMPGEIGRFLHGGPSIQEIIVGIIIIEFKKKAKKVEVKWKIPSAISTAIFIVEIRPVSPTIGMIPRNIKVEVYDKNQIITETNTEKILFNSLKFKIKLSRIPDTVEIRLKDSGTGEILNKAINIPVQLSGYDEII